MNFCRINARLVVGLSLFFLFLGNLSADDSLDKTRKLRAKGEYARAVRECKKSLDDEKLDESVRKVLILELAAAYQFDSRENHSEEATEVYRQFLERWPEDPFAAKAHFNLARCLEFIGKYRDRDLEEARTHYRTVYEKFPKSVWADQSYFWEAMSYAASLNKESAKEAVGRLKGFEILFPSSSLRAAVSAEISELACSYLEDYDLAMESGLMAMELGLKNQQMREKMSYRLAYLYHYKKGDITNALKWYKALVAASPMKSDPNYFVAEERIAAIESGDKTKEAPQ